MVTKVCEYCGLNGHAVHCDCGRAVVGETCSHCYPETPVMTKTVDACTSDEVAEVMESWRLNAATDDDVDATKYVLNSFGNPIWIAPGFNYTVKTP